MQQPLNSQNSKYYRKSNKQCLQWVTTRNFPNISLRWVLIVPFVLQIVGAVGLLGYLSYGSGKKVVEDMANQLMDQATNWVQDHLEISLQAREQGITVNNHAV